LGCCPVCCCGVCADCSPVFSGCGFSSAITVRLINQGRNQKYLTLQEQDSVKTGLFLLNSLRVEGR
jgi:hypothetical protein